MDLRQNLVEEVGAYTDYGILFHHEFLTACQSYLQAPPTVHYFPNFVTAEEADYLWRQVVI